MTLKNNRAPLLCYFKFVYHFIAIGQFKLELESGHPQLWSKSTIFCLMRPWNLTDDLEKQYSTSPKQHQWLCIISSSYVNSNWSYGQEMAKLGFDLCDLDLWPLALTGFIQKAHIKISWLFPDFSLTHLKTHWLWIIPQISVIFVYVFPNVPLT